MEKNYSINEILSAIDEIYNFKKNKKIVNNKNVLTKEDFSSVPKSTLKIIEEAEQYKK
tara:strand:- start:28 stop:201 length:174 start_codon:yes stop_codon:yes gene_type:complete